MNHATHATGLDRVRAYLEGESTGSGLEALLGMRMVSAEHGKVTFAAEPGPQHTNPGGTVHGGYVASLLDTALGCAAITTLGAGEMTTSLEFKVTFLRPCRPDGRTVMAHGSVDRSGRRVVFTSAQLCDDAGQVLATATSTLLVLHPAAAG
jgi:uncharacterized protein (TIGR00369 family)